MIELTVYERDGEVVAERINAREQERSPRLGTLLQAHQRIVGRNLRNFKKIGLALALSATICTLLIAIVALALDLLGITPEGWFFLSFGPFVTFMFLMVVVWVYRSRVYNSNISLKFRHSDNTGARKFNDLFEVMKILNRVDRKRIIRGSTVDHDPRYEAGAASLVTTKNIDKVDFGMQIYKGSDLFSVSEDEAIVISRKKLSGIRRLMEFFLGLFQQGNISIGPNFEGTKKFAFAASLMAGLWLLLMVHAVSISTTYTTTNVVFLILHALLCSALVGYIAKRGVGNPYRVATSKYNSFTLASEAGIIDFSYDEAKHKVECRSIPLDDLTIDFDYTEQRFIESEEVPKDAKVVDHAWQYSNKDKSRDQRFNDNKQLPVTLVARCNYRVSLSGDRIPSTGKFELSNLAAAEKCWKILQPWHS